MTKINIPSKNISKLDLSNSNLTEIPHEIFELKNLRKLILSNNKIKVIPQEITNLKLLQTLDVSNNKLTNFFAKLCELKKLEVLNLNNNEITSIPKQVSKLEKLRKFSFANNKVKTLPDEFSSLQNLISLNISKNRFVEFPNQVYELKKLKHLWISNLTVKKFSLDKINKNLINLKSIYAYSSLLDSNSTDEDYFKLSVIKGNSINKVPIFLNEKKYSHSIQTKTNKIEHSLINQTNNNKSMIFISYSHEDKDWLNKVQKNLKVLNYQNITFELWDDTKIKAGQNWKNEIEKALDNAKVAILLISTDFLASEFIQNNELPTLLKNAKENGCEILPLIVGHCRFTKDKLSVFQSINNPSKPLNDCSKPECEKFLVDLTNRIEEILNK